MINTDSTAAVPVLLPLRTFLKQYSISKSEFPAASAAAWLAARVRPAIEISRDRNRTQPR
jgi:hypothetical protein